MSGGSVRFEALARGLAWDVGLPVAVYYALHLAGASDLVALVAASVVAAARVAVVALRSRTLNVFAAITLVIFGGGLLLVALTGDPRVLLLKASVISAGLGILFVATGVRGRRPLTLAALQGFEPRRAAEIAARFAAEPAVRRGHRLTSVVWGLGLIAEAVVRVVLVLLLPLPVMVGVSPVLSVVAVGGLLLWTRIYLGRFRRAPQPA
ncbi:MAG: VC0807 family protein [Pseudonocardia sp.]